jgi:hypothetical protein
MEVSMSISEVMNNMMVGLVRKVSEQVVSSCALKYGFSAEEALRELGIVVSVSKSISKKDVPKAKKMVASFPLPFNGEHSSNNCQALRQNNGLYTQCQSAKKSVNFCKSCEQLASKSEDGIPEYGTISQRLACDPFAYIDPKGRKPTAYTKVMKKYKLTKEQVLEEAAKFGIQINEAHFVAPEETKRGRPASAPKEAKEPKGSKGRPKKTAKVVQIADDDDDLFASLVASANQPLDEPKESDPALKAEKEAEKEAEKAAKLAAKEAEKTAKAEKLAAEKAEKEAKLAAAKAEKEAKLAAEKAEKEAKLAAAKAEKEAKLAKAEQEKQEKAAKLAAEKEAKEAAKLAAKEAAKLAAKEAKKTTPKTTEEPEETYKKCGEGKYIRSQQTGIVYDFEKYTETEELYPVGKWNADKKEIIFDKADDDELSEDEVDDDE